MADVYTAVTSYPVGYVDITGLLTGIATIIVIFGIGIFLFKLFRPMFAEGNVEKDYINTERIAIRRYLTNKKKINLDKEIAKLQIDVENKFQKRLEKEVEEDFFGKEKEE